MNPEPSQTEPSGRPKPDSADKVIRYFSPLCAIALIIWIVGLFAVRADMAISGAILYVGLLNFMAKAP